MSFDLNIYTATMNNPNGPIFVPEMTDWTPSSDDESATALEFDGPPSPAVTIALLLNAVMLLAFLGWLLLIIF